MIRANTRKLFGRAHQPYVDWCARIRRSAERVQFAGGLLVALLAAGCATGPGVGSSPYASPAGGISGPGKSHIIESKLAKIGQYEDRRRWETYLGVGELFDRLWLQPASRRVLRKGEFQTFKDYPVLILEDRDEDGKADFYGYHPPGGTKDTQEFGAFFDLSGDGLPDWIVFYGGSAMTNEVKLFYWHHHAIDTNGDGRFDVRIYGLIDMDGDGFPEEGATAWVYDIDHDGLVDKAEHIIDGRVTQIEAENGALPLRHMLKPDLSKQPRVAGPVPTELLRVIADDINALSGT